MGSNALETLFAACASQIVGRGLLFMGAEPHAALQVDENQTLYQPFKPAAEALSAAGYTPKTEVSGTHDLALILMPKNRVEAEYWLALALQHTAPHAEIYVAAANDAGGKRLEKMLRVFGVEDTQTLSKNKARAVWGCVPDALNEAAQKALTAGAPQHVLDGAYLSRAGVFGWDKIDKGSALLVQHLPQQLKGRGADFGCGYGYLSREILAQDRGDKVKTLACLDADARAVMCCTQNVNDPRASHEWRDLTKDSGLKNLDFIVMNPPFHAGKTSDSDIGVAFIRTAYNALCPRGGTLYMVANAQLPYELTLNDLFFSVEKLCEAQGFKVYKAVR